MVGVAWSAAGGSGHAVKGVWHIVEGIGEASATLSAVCTRGSVGEVLSDGSVGGVLSDGSVGGVEQGGSATQVSAVYGPEIYGPATYGDDFADVYDDWYSDVSDVAATADCVADLCAGSRVLELGVGTGRLALAIAAKGISIDGVDSSGAMLRRLAVKDPAGTVGSLLADIGAGITFGRNVPADGRDVLPVGRNVLADGRVHQGDGTFVGGPYRVVLAAYNTFFNLDSEQAQLRCLRSVAQSLELGGRLLLEAFVPAVNEPELCRPVVDEPEPYRPVVASAFDRPVVDEPEPYRSAVNEPVVDESAFGPHVEVRRRGDSLLLNVSVRDTDQQLVRGRHIEVRLERAGAGCVTGPDAACAADPLADIVRIRAWQIRYLTPSQLDALASQAGLVLSCRWADWRRNPFDDSSTQHISVYELA